MPAGAGEGLFGEMIFPENPVSRQARKRFLATGVLGL